VTIDPHFTPRLLREMEGPFKGMLIGALDKVKVYSVAPLHRCEVSIE
jgi:hypothetical protein